jgi:hypothetical protein
MSVIIQLRRGTAAQWTSVNPILAQGEQGLETDTNKFKVGDGIQHWNDLPYLFGGINTGDVTIGTANGLSLIGQELSMASASSSTIGTLNDVDWNTFNNKMDGDTQHNELMGIQGGSTSERYHLTLAQHDTLTSVLPKGALGVVLDGGGLTITTGIKGYLQIPFNCIIHSWTLLADQAGSAVMDVWKTTFAGFPPLVGNSITGSTPPTLSGQATTSSTLTGWTTTIYEGDIIAFNVVSATSIQRLTLELSVIKTIL